MDFLEILSNILTNIDLEFWQKIDFSWNFNSKPKQNWPKMDFLDILS